jgi:predicted negative regulator of RcsB-dependent stress response
VKGGNIMSTLLFVLGNGSTTTTNTDAFTTMINPIINLLNSALSPILALVVAAGAIYCVFLGLKLAKAEEPQDREKAKAQLKNAIIGFLLIFVLIVALKLGLKPMENWMNTQTGTTTTAAQTG